MPYDIIIGREESERKKFGKEGSILIGKQYVKMGQSTSMSNEIYMDVTRSHTIFICGKRGSGKSYTMGVIAEGISLLPDEIKNNISVIILDTMGVYWTMKYGNKEDAELLNQWDLKSKGLNVQIYTPSGFYKKFKDEGTPTDFSFSIKPSELSAYDWCMTFEVPLSDPVGVLIERVIDSLRESKKDFSLDDVIAEIREDKKTGQNIKNAAENRFSAAKNWGIFSVKGTKIDDLAIGGQITVLDISCYAMTSGAEGLRALVIGLVSKKLFIERMVARRKEEHEAIQKEVHFIEKSFEKNPMVWLIVDEAHEFLPSEGKTPASDALITILREGRQPGISLVLASQQPGKIHTDVMTQSDIIISHRITAKVDTDALGTLMQSYMREGLDKQLMNLPSVKGAAITFDDVNERMYPMRIRPRISWHGGSAPIALREKKKIFSF